MERMARPNDLRTATTLEEGAGEDICYLLLVIADLLFKSFRDTLPERQASPK
jgi:hypothetical protein